MKKVVLKSIFLAISLLSSLAISAQTPANVEEQVKQIVAEYDKVKGVECIAIDNGAALGLLKTMFKQKFGKDFMKDVTSMVIINYSGASEDVAATLRGKLESFSSVLEEFKLDDKEVKAGQYMKCYATLKNKILSNFMVLLEENESRMYIYMGGNLVVDKLDLQL